METTTTVKVPEWKAIPGFKGYFARSDGVISQKNKFHPLSFFDSHGYSIVHMSVEGKSKKVRAHRLVALTFLGVGRDGATEVNHKNCITTDNRVENLEWTNPKDNMKHFHAKMKAAGKCLMPQRIGAYNPVTEETKTWPSMGQAAKYFSVDASTMCGVAIHYHKSEKLYKGFRLWKLDEDWEPCVSAYPLRETIFKPSTEKA